jgi:hypothetical protein
MDNIKKFSDFIQVNEAAIMPIDIEQMISELESELRINNRLPLDAANAIVEEYGVIFIDYQTFYLGLRPDLRRTAPPENTPIFGFFREDGTICIVVGGHNRMGTLPTITLSNLGFINHVIQHESIHTEQWRRRAGKVEYTLPDPKDRKSYFGNKDEIMAFAQSVVEMMMTQGRLTSMSQLQTSLDRNPLWNSIKNSGVSQEVKNRYLKYIYEYANNYLENDIH